MNPLFIQWPVFFIFIANTARKIPSLYIAVFGRFFNLFLPMAVFSAMFFDLVLTFFPK